MSSLAAKARYNRLGGSTGVQTVTPPPGTPPLAPHPTVLTVQDANVARTAAVADNNRIIEFTNAAAITYTIKEYDEVPLPVGAILYALQEGDGQITFAADTGVTFEDGDSYKTRAKSSIIAMKHTSLNVWRPLGDLATTIAALSILANPTNASAAPQTLAASATLQVLIRRGTALVFDALAQSDITGLVAALALLAPLASPTFTGTPAAPTAAPGTSTTQIATTAFVAALGALKANLASPTFTGTPAAPTAAPGTNTTQIATTAFVAALGALKVDRAPILQSVVSSATVTPTAAQDMVVITAQAAALNLANPTGTPSQGQLLTVRIKDNGTARAITYGTQYRAMGVALPATTVINKTLYLFLVYNSTDTKWDLVDAKQEA